jgi:curved DNA-binding protein
MSLEWENGMKINAEIPPGVKPGARVRIKGQGGEGSNDGQRGDLLLNISIATDPRLQQDNGDLRTTVQVDLFTMLLGGEYSVSGVDRTLKLDIPFGTRNGCIFKLKGLGMPNLKRPLHFGDLYVKAEVILPQSLTAEEKDLVEHWRNIH